MSKKGCIVSFIVFIIVLVILVTCGAICVLFASAVGSMDTSSMSEVSSIVLKKGGDNKIAVIRIEGTIVNTNGDAGLFSSGYASAETINKYLDEAMNDSSVKAIVLDVNTPGGGVYASDEINNKILEVQQNGKIVVSLMRDMAASCGYYVSAPSDKIIASSLTLTGSIGVRLDVQSMEGLYEKIGIESRTITNSGGDYKTGEGLFDDDPNGQEDQIYQSIVDEAFDRFVSIVADGRDMTKDEVIEIADGRVFTGLQAKEVGLVDELGNFDTAISSAEELAGISDATIIEYNELGFLSLFSSYISEITPASLMKADDVRPGLHLLYIYDGS